MGYKPTLDLNLKDYLRNIAIALDQLVGSFIPGAYPDETISSRAFRENWKIQSIINWIFRDPLHCEDSYWSEINQRQNFTRK